MPKRFVDPALSDSLCIVFLIFLIWQVSVPAQVQAQPQPGLEGKNVLILHSLEGSAPVFVDTDKALITTLESGGIPRVNQFLETLDLRRNPGPEHRRLLVEQMHMRYGHRKPDMIITMYPEALEFVLKDCRDIFPYVPILAMYLPEGFELPETDRSIIGHSAQPDIIGTFEIALKLVPGAKRVYVVSGVHAVDRMIEDRARRELKKWEGRLEFHYLSQMSFKDVVATISTAPPDSVILALVVSQDVTGRSFTSVEVAQRLNQVSPAPIFGLLDAALGHGSVGGSLINFERIGTKAGEVVLDLLRGVPATVSTPKVLDVPPVPMFDWRQLRRWNLSVDALPKGSIVINKELTLWDFKYYIIGGLALCLVQSLLIAGLLLQRRHRRSAEEALEERLKFETLLAEISAHFVNLPTDQIDSEIEGAQRRICELFDLDRSTLWQTFEGKPGTLLLTHIHQPPGSPSPIERMMSGRVFFPWMAQKVLDGETVITSKMTDLLPEGARDRESFLAIGTKCGVYVPLSVGEGPVFGVLTFAVMREERSWPETVVMGFKLIAQVFANALARKRAEAEVARTRSELLHVERSTRLNELTASLAHELNQPLTAILSNAQAALRFLKSDKPDLNEFREILQDIISDDQRAGNVIRSLRSMMKREEGEKKPTILNDILNDVIQIFRSEAILQNVSIETESDGPLPPVLGDKGQLQQVVLNIVMNAAEAMSRNPPEQRKLILRTQRKDHSIWVAVRDFGPGIDKDNLERVFQPFFTTKRTGLGMGLSVCSSIIRDHRGRIWAENNPDGGATLTFEIPVIRSQ